MIEQKALKVLVDKGYLPAEPVIENGSTLILVVERTYGSGADGRTYTAAVVGRVDEIGNRRWTATGRHERTPFDATWPEFLVWLTTPSKSKWKLSYADHFTNIADSKKLNHELYRSGK